MAAVCARRVRRREDDPSKAVETERKGYAARFATKAPPRNAG